MAGRARAFLEQLLDQPVQGRAGHRLGHHRIQILLFGMLFQQAAFVGGDHHDDRMRAGRGACTNLACNGHPVDIGHAPVEQENIVGLCSVFDGLQRGLSAGYGIHAPAKFGGDAHQVVERCIVVVGDQYARHRFRRQDRQFALCLQWRGFSSVTTK